jgi:hypothetical protein
MKHFSSEDWADFARDIAEWNPRTLIESHLRIECDECAKALRVWRRVRDAARREAAYGPPDEAVRTVKGNYAIHGERVGRRGRGKIAELLFDTLLGPLPEGVRSLTSTTRQMLFGAGDYRIDVRFESQPEKLFLFGQVLNSAAPEKQVEAAPVTLLKGRKVLAESQTSRLGEFHLACGPAAGLRLRIGLPYGGDVSIPLLEPAVGKSAGTPNPEDSKGIKRVLGRHKIRAGKP